MEHIANRKNWEGSRDSWWALTSSSNRRLYSVKNSGFSISKRSHTALAPRQVNFINNYHDDNTDPVSYTLSWDQLCIGTTRDCRQTYILSLSWNYVQKESRQNRWHCRGENKLTQRSKPWVHIACFSKCHARILFRHWSTQTSFYQCMNL